MQTVFGILVISSVLVFVIGMINPKLFSNKKTGEVADRKTLAIGSIALFLFSLAMVGMLGDEESSSNTETAKSEIIASDVPATGLESSSVPTPVIHNYSLKDGYEYGYEAVLSENDKANGKVAADVLMFKYAGDRDNTVQVYQKSGDIATIIECVFPCEFLKIITYSTSLGYISTDRMRRTAGTIGAMVIADALNSELEQYVAERDGKKYNVWWDEQSGVSYTALQ